MSIEVVLIGRGAIGGAYCSELCDVEGVNFRVAASKEKVERYRKEGYIYNGKELKLDYFTPGEEAVKADIVLVTTKWEGFEESLRLLTPVVDNHTVILPLLNGLLPLDVAKRVFPGAQVLIGYYFGKTAVREGNSTRLKGGFVTHYAECGADVVVDDSGVTAAERAVAELFDKTKLRYSIDRDILPSRWHKMIVNVGFNQVSALDGGLNYTQIRESKERKELCEGLMREAILVAKSDGVQGIDEEQKISDIFKTLESLNGEDYTSMAQDVREGRETEWEVFGGYLLSRAEALELDLPHHRWLEAKYREQGVIK